MLDRVQRHLVPPQKRALVRFRRGATGRPIVRFAIADSALILQVQIW
jgi:hypothetical protein